MDKYVPYIPYFIFAGLVIIGIVVGIVSFVSELIRKKKEATCICGYKTGRISSESLYKIEVDEKYKAFAKSEFVATYYFRCPKCKNETSLEFCVGTDYYDVPNRVKEIAVKTLGFSQYAVIPQPSLKINLK
jgi:hypothetical protein